MHVGFLGRDGGDKNWVHSVASGFVADCYGVTFVGWAKGKWVG